MHLGKITLHWSNNLVFVSWKNTWKILGWRFPIPAGQTGNTSSIPLPGYNGILESETYSCVGIVQSKSRAKFNQNSIEKSENYCPPPEWAWAVLQWRMVKISVSKCAKLVETYPERLAAVIAVKMTSQLYLYLPSPAPKFTIHMTLCLHKVRISERGE